MRKTFLYLDDENTKTTSVFTEVLKRADKRVVIDIRHPLPFSEQMNLLKTEKENFSGLILDLRLDLVSNDNKKADYRALTLAQEIRTRATEGTFPAFPIFLWSTDERLNKSYKRDESGHDLFDAKFLKTEIIRNSKDVALKLFSIAQGYEDITSIKNKISGRGEYLHELFKISKEESENLDKRLLNYFGTVEGKMPEHEYARLLLREMLEIPGVLINEKYLAARLGIDMMRSKDWPLLRRQLYLKAGYSGPFKEAYPRWWMYRVSDWWYSLKNCPGNLSFLEAEVRVTFLKSATRYKQLIAAKPLKQNYSTQFWTVCKALEVPIDLKDAFVTDGRSSQPWQDKEYISIEAAVKRTKYKEGIRVHPLEEGRLREIKSFLK